MIGKNEAVSCYPYIKSSPLNVFDLKYADWKSADVIDLATQDMVISDALKVSIEPEMWRNLVAEYDAANLCDFLRAKNGYSEKFRYFEDIWLHDELNHYDGLRLIYSHIYGVTEDAIHRRVIARKADFSRIEKLIDSEFSTLVCFAYDELCSARGYSEAFELYDSFSVSSVSDWIRRVARDEMFHSINAQRILLSNYAERLGDVADTLARVLAVDCDSSNQYAATFLFDHHEDGDHNPFSSQFLYECAADICKYLRVESPKEWSNHG